MFSNKVIAPRITLKSRPFIIDPIREFTQFPGWRFFGNEGGEIELNMDSDEFTEHGHGYDWTDDYDTYQNPDIRTETEFDMWQYVMETV